MVHINQSTSLTIESLVERVKFGPGRAWMNTYFDLMAFLLFMIGLTDQDRRLCMSIPKEPVNKYPILPVSINQRWVITSSADGTVSIIYACDFDPDRLPAKTRNSIVRYERYGHMPGESYDEIPWWVTVTDIDRLILSERLKDGWIRGAKHELLRAKGGPFLDHHRSEVYKAAVNLDYRTLVLDQAFQGTMAE